MLMKERPIPKLKFKLRLLSAILTIACFTLSPNRVNGAGKTIESQTSPRLFHLGVLGAEGNSQVGRSDIVVTKVEDKFPAAIGGLKVNDIITAAKVNDTDSDFRYFEEDDNDHQSGGKGPREGLGLALDDALGTASRTITLKVIRNANTSDYIDSNAVPQFIIENGTELDLVIKLPDMGSIGQSGYPFNTTVNEYAKQVADHMATKLVDQTTGARWSSDIVTDVILATAMLGTGDQRYHRQIKKYAEYVMEQYSRARKGYGVGRGTVYNSAHQWSFSYVGMFLCDYYTATGDQRAIESLNVIAELMCETTKNGTSTRGMHGHGYRPGSGYQSWNDGSGLNIVTTTHYSF